MVISHKYRYLFVEVPLTGSWTIRQELCDNYEGMPILHKHATYQQFRRVATPKEMGYFVFGTVRNPLDMLVSQYIKIATNHGGGFANVEAAQQFLSDYSDVKKYSAILKGKMNFADYLIAYHQRPYSDLLDNSYKYLTYLLRFEDLQNGFDEVLASLSIKKYGTLPITNQTVEKFNNWESYYPFELRMHAKKICTPYMMRYGYEFPVSWGNFDTVNYHVVKYNVYNLIRYIYVEHFKYNTSYLATKVRQLRAVFN
jgi:hypothetical protein